MADDAYEERFRQHAEILQGLYRMLEAQHDRNRQQDTINDRLTRAIERIDQTLAQVEITQARVETLLARMIRHEENGQEA